MNFKQQNSFFEPKTININYLREDNAKSLHGLFAKKLKGKYESRKEA